MIKIKYENKIYQIEKEKLIFILEKLNNEKIKENEIEKYLEKFKLYDKYFLENINKI